jgi:hypothetical protein
VQRKRGHELVEASKTTFPVAELLKMVGEFDGLVVRRWVICLTYRAASLSLPFAICQAEPTLHKCR